MNINKNIAIATRNNMRGQLIFISLLLMIASLYISRASLSISFIFFLALTIVHKHLKEQFRTFLNNALLIGMAALFLVPFISGLWSKDLQQWLNVIQLKLPFLFFPLAFAGSWQLTKTQWKIVAAFFLLCLALGCIWSLGNYWLHFNEMNESYTRAKLIDTPLENDHVRFSWLVSIGIIASVLLTRITVTKATKILLSIACLFFIVYLHILSARTGLICFYLFAAIYVAWLLFRRKSLQQSIWYLLLIIALPVLAWFTIPTFEKRWNYLVYDLSFVKSSTYVPGSNDGARFFSIKAGSDILKTNPFGTGAGDVMKVTNQWYDSKVPKMLTSDRLYPSSEWLMYGAYAGWLGIAIFTLIMFIPFLQRTRHRIFWIALNLVCLFSFAFDIGLEVQFGIFLYSFIVLWWYKWLKPESINE